MNSAKGATRCACDPYSPEQSYGYEENVGDIEIINGIDVTDQATFYDAVDPNLIYSNCSLGEIKQGVSFTIRGKILLHCERFSINLIVNTPTRDIALHLNPRLPQNYIVRNCKIKEIWGTEEVTSSLPFILRRGRPFCIQILVTNTNYMIALNGKHFAAYEHRLPFNRVTCLEVKGDVDNITMDKTFISEYPTKSISNVPFTIDFVTELDLSDSNISINTESLAKLQSEELQMPFYGTLPQDFLDGKVLIVHGRVKILPHSFFLNLQSGHSVWPHPTIAFHFNPRFTDLDGGRHVICRNSWFNGKWDKEERTESTTEIMPGKHFTLVIYCTTTAYEVYLNKKFIAEYKFRVKPHMVDTIYIQGDIKLWFVALSTQMASEFFH